MVFSKLCYYFTHLIVIINSLNPVHTTTLILLIIVIVIMTMIIMIVHVCRNSIGLALSTNRFTREGVEQIKKAVRERNSAGDMTELELLIDEPSIEYT